MCGITGFFSFDKRLFKEQLVCMTEKLTRRGPDAHGYYFDGEVGLGHRRLSIIDLSSFANQPMFSSSGRYVLVFNGEIYNYKELAREWKLALKTSSDTEVLLEGFEKFGPDFVQKLNGMFAFSIYDIQQKELHLFRDRLGVKPLYYFWDGNDFVFASEIKSIVALGEKLKIGSVNKKAINQFLHLGYIPEPNTIFENIHKFPSGSYLKFNDNDFQMKSYWRIEDKIESQVLNDKDIAKERLKELLESSIKLRLNSDVPFGVFLSGGIDSSLVAAVSQSISTVPIKTFSIGFDEVKFNEAKYAKTISGFLKTDHHEFYLSEREGLDVFEKVLDNFDEPFADTSAIPTYMVSLLARKSVTMVLTGDGGDELFMGYGSYQWAKRLSAPYIHSLRKVAAVGLGALPSNRYKRASNLFKYQNKNNIKSHIFSQEQYFFSELEIRKIINNPDERNLTLNQNFDTLKRKISPREAQALFDINYYLKDDLLTKVDRTSMFCSLEAREPLLDYRIVEFAINLSEQLKVRNGDSKYLLKQVLFDYIPAEYFNRPKWGFSIPISIWLKKDLKYLLDQYLSKESIECTGLFKFEEVNKLKERFYNGEDYLYNRILVLTLLQRWLLKYMR